MGITVIVKKKNILVEEGVYDSVCLPYIRIKLIKIIE